MGYTLLAVTLIVLVGAGVAFASAWYSDYKVTKAFRETGIKEE